MPAAESAAEAAIAYGVSVERFRKHHERIVIEQIAEDILELCAPALTPSPTRVAGRTGPQISLTGQVGERRFPLVVHVEPVELLSAVDILVAQERVLRAAPAFQPVGPGRDTQSHRGKEA